MTAATAEERFRPHLDKVASGGALNEDEAAAAFDAIMEGGIPEVQLAGFLVAMKARGETVDEITGAVRTMRTKMKTVTAKPSESWVPMKSTAVMTTSLSTRRWLAPC